MTNAHIDERAEEIQLNIDEQKEMFAFKPKDEQCSQVTNFNRKRSKKKLEKPSIYTLIEFVENLRIREEIKVYNDWNMKRSIQRKKLLELEKKDRNNSAYTEGVAKETVAANVIIK